MRHRQGSSNPRLTADTVAPVCRGGSRTVISKDPAPGRAPVGDAVDTARAGTEIVALVSDAVAPPGRRVVAATLPPNVQVAAADAPATRPTTTAVRRSER